MVLKYRKNISHKYWLNIAKRICDVCGHIRWTEEEDEKAGIPPQGCICLYSQLKRKKHIPHMRIT